MKKVTLMVEKEVTATKMVEVRLYVPKVMDMNKSRIENCVENYGCKGIDCWECILNDNKTFEAYKESLKKVIPVAELKFKEG